MLLNKTLESPLDCKEIQPVHPKENCFWIFIGRTDAEAETPILSPPDVKNWLIRNDPNAGKDWRQEEKGTAKDEMVAWHHWLNGREFEQVLGVGDGQGGLFYCSPFANSWTKLSNWTELSLYAILQLLYPSFSCWNLGLYFLSGILWELSYWSSTVSSQSISPSRLQRKIFAVCQGDHAICLKAIRWSEVNRICDWKEVRKLGGLKKQKKKKKREREWVASVNTR